MLLRRPTSEIMQRTAAHTVALDQNVASANSEASYSNASVPHCIGLVVDSLSLPLQAAVPGLTTDGAVYGKYAAQHHHYSLRGPPQ